MTDVATGPIHPLVRLAQRFTIDWLNRADGDVPPQIMTPDYQVHIGGIDLDGLEAYAPATLGQLTQFPGLQLTIHDLATDLLGLEPLDVTYGLRRLPDRGANGVVDARR